MMAKRVIHKDHGPCCGYAKRVSLCLECNIPTERTSCVWRNVTCKNCLRLRPKKGKR
jgi:hypothetical protein